MAALILVLYHRRLIDTVEFAPMDSPLLFFLVRDLVREDIGGFSVQRFGGSIDLFDILCIPGGTCTLVQVFA